jgi:hypothetical protein
LFFFCGPFSSSMILFVLVRYRYYHLPFVLYFILLGFCPYLYVPFRFSYPLRLSVLLSVFLSILLPYFHVPLQPSVFLTFFFLPYVFLSTIHVSSVLPCPLQSVSILSALSCFHSTFHDLSIIPCSFLSCPLSHLY